MYSVPPGMADTDVIGIVSLLLAAGGAAYLFRARVLNQRAEAEAAAAAEEEEARTAAEARAAVQKTVPPKLRPASDPPPAPSKRTMPQTPEAKAEAAVASEKREKLKEVKETQVSRKDPLEKPPPKREDEDEKLVDPPKAETPKPAIVPPKPPETPKPALPKKPSPSKPEIAAKPAASESKVTVPDKKSFKKQTIVGVPEPALLPAKAPTLGPNDKLPDLPQIDIPRLDVEEDEDVEPTRVGRYERQSIRPPVERHVFDEGADGKVDPRTSKPLDLVVYALAQTDPGKRRKQNEDSFLVREKLGVYVVADGMGGHRGGEFASKCAVDTIAKAFETKKFDAEAHADIPLEASELARSIQMANAAILAEASAKPELKGMGTTLCAARFTEDARRLFLGHVGDSRCYRVRGGVMTQMTKDHTMADYGVAGPEGAHLSRALGVWPTVPIDIIMAAPELNDVYLICSDGLTKMLTNETIQTQLLHEEDPKAAVERLVFFANAHGGKDNITVILLRVVEPGWAPPSERAGQSSA